MPRHSFVNTDASVLRDSMTVRAARARSENMLRCANNDNEAT